MNLAATDVAPDVMCTFSPDIEKIRPPSACSYRACTRPAVWNTAVLTLTTGGESTIVNVRPLHGVLDAPSTSSPLSSGVEKELICFTAGPGCSHCFLRICHTPMTLIGVVGAYAHGTAACTSYATLGDTAECISEPSRWDLLYGVVYWCRNASNFQIFYGVSY